MLKLFLLYLSCLAVTLAAKIPNDINLKPLKTSEERIKEQGYPAESHLVETIDGYVLNLFRIPYSPKLKNANVKKPAVFIQHGLFSSSDCYLLSGRDNALAYNFADAGFDVWLGNARGNIYSRANNKISLKNPNFWKFSWHEIGSIDIPTSIDYVLSVTGEKQLHYVGHSQGTTVFFVMASSKPEYNDKIKTAHMLAPAIFMGNATDGLIVGFAPLIGKPGLGSQLLENQEFIPKNPVIQRVLDTACGGAVKYPKYCKTLFLLWAGQQQTNLNSTILPQLAETHPAGISANQAIHYIQSHVSNEFRQYDWGAKKNMKIYGQEEPPKYPLNKISANMFLYYGLADESAAARDVERLPQYLPNLKLLYQLPDPTFNHLDFIFSWQVKETINDKVIQACLQYEDK